VHAPRTPTEDVLASIWREVLNVKQVGVHDNFFDLGGHSLLAMQVVARLSKLLNVDLPLQRFFETPTISALATDLQTMVGATKTSKLHSRVSALHADNLPLSFAQQRLWFLDRLLPSRATYNIPTVWRLLGPLDVPALERNAVRRLPGAVAPLQRAGRYPGRHAHCRARAHRTRIWSMAYIESYRTRSVFPTLTNLKPTWDYSFCVRRLHCIPWAFCLSRV
jgi:acyl carrier protein